MIDSKRNHGVDLLRIVSMLMIIVLHIIVNNGLLKEEQILTYRGEVTWLIWTLCMCGDICFAMISGYVYADGNYNLFNIVKLWLIAEFYSVSFGLLNYFIYEKQTGLSIGNILKYFFPLLSRSYWYFTEYFLLYLMIPLLIIGISAMPKKQCRNTLITVLFVITVAQGVYNVDCFELNHGFSCMWLAILFSVGAYIKKYNPYKDISNKKLIICYLLVSVFSWAWQLINRLLFSKYETLNLLQAFFYCRHTIFISCLSPAMVIQGISLLIAFSRLSVNKFSGFINKFSSVSFPVYIIHCSPFFSSLIVDWFSGACLKLNNFLLPFAYFASSIIIYLLCTFLDKMRITVFKVLKINYHINKAKQLYDKLII